MKKVTTFMKDATSKVSSGFKRATLMGSAAMCTAQAGMLKVFAADEGTNEMDKIMSRILDLIYKIFRYAGILLLVWAIAQIVMAFKNDDADSKQKGMILAVISVILITLSFAVGPILTVAGFNYVPEE